MLSLPQHYNHTRHAATASVIVIITIIAIAIVITINVPMFGLRL